MNDMEVRQLWILHCYILLTVTLLCQTVGGFYLRARREAGEEGEGGENANRGSFALPLAENSHPFPSIGSDTMGPAFPFTHSFSNGMDINRGDIFEANGHLNIPVPGWGMWDFKGHQVAGPTHTWYNYGHFLSPADPYHLGPSTMAQLGNQAAARATMEKDSSSPGVQSVPVVQLPAGFVPAQCKPPMCNPFIHTFDMGTQVEPGDDRMYQGSLDFPFQAKDGTVRRFPLSGDLVAGNQPISVLYGQGMNPVNPFPKLSDKNTIRQSTSQVDSASPDRHYETPDSASHSENSVHTDSPSYKPFSLPSYSSSNHAQSNGRHYFHGNEGLVMPPDIPVSPSRDSVLPSMPNFPSLTPSSGRK